MFENNVTSVNLEIVQNLAIKGGIKKKLPININIVQL